jgi:Holliday junction resolvasome RuvABC ATP-dependent DNA helicase subunit
MNIYEIVINLCKENLKKEINMVDRVNDISKSVNEFNSSLKYSKQLLLLEVRLNKVVVLFRGNPLTFNESENIKSINRFLSTLIMKYKWKEYLNTKGKKFFDVKVVKIHKASSKEKVFNDTTIVNLKKYNSTSNINRFLMNVDLNEVNKKIIGCNEFKKETEKIHEYIKLNKTLSSVDKSVKKELLPYHYLFKGSYGINQYKMAKKLARILFSIDVIENFQVYKIDGKIQNSYFWNSSFKEFIKKNKYGMVFIENITVDNSEASFDEVIDSILNEMKKWRGRIIFILSYYEDNLYQSNFQKLLTKLKMEVNFRVIEFPFYNDNELKEILKNYIKRKSYRVEENSVEMIVKYIQTIKFNLDTDLYYLVDKVIERALVEKRFKYIENSNKSKNMVEIINIKKEDLNFLNEEILFNNEKVKLAIDELNKLVGLKEVKMRIEDIYDFVRVKMKKKDLGLPFNKICMHMEFTGNPGTGKTTVARIIGKMLKDLGYLSKGHFVEITRENLIGEYIGQTLPKVKKVVNEALGGILFIDEAYNLYMNDKSDYGVEAISYLVKFMEDNKDDLIIIFAGYPKEMEAMIKVNPGLRDRIAFKVNFPDYSDGELLDIFLKFSKDNHYSITPGAKNEAFNFIKNIKRKKISNFGNARFIRKVFERIELIQNKRICLNELYSKKDIQKIIKEDVLKLNKDIEIQKIINDNENNNKIGF